MAISPSLSFMVTLPYYGTVYCINGYLIIILLYTCKWAHFEQVSYLDVNVYRIVAKVCPFVCIKGFDVLIGRSWSSKVEENVKSGK